MAAWNSDNGWKDALASAWREWTTPVIILLASAPLIGCAALTNPVADGVPVHLLPAQYLGRSREDDKPIPLNLLRQPPPDVYRLDAGDILGVYIETVLGDRNQAPPVRYAEQGNVTPALGYPVPVQEDGTLLLPYIKPVQVKGMSIKEAREAIAQAYQKPEQILKPDKDALALP